MDPQWLAQHPFLVRDLRRLRKKHRLARFLLVPPFITILLLFGLCFLGIRDPHFPTTVTDCVLIVVTLAHTLTVLFAADPLGDWQEELAGGRAEALRLLPLSPRTFIISFAERRFFLKLLLGVGFLPIYVLCYLWTSVDLATLCGVYVLLGLAAWVMAPCSAAELAGPRLVSSQAGSKSAVVTGLRGWPAMLLVSLFLGVATTIFISMTDVFQNGSHSHLSSIIIWLRYAYYLPCSLPLVLGHYMLTAHSFFGLRFPAVLWIAAVAYLTREIKILNAVRALRAEPVKVTISKALSRNMLRPPEERIREDRPIHRLQVRRGLVVRICLLGAAWSLLQRFAPESWWTMLIMGLLALGALDGIYQAAMGSGSLLLPGRIKGFLQKEMPRELAGGRVSVPPRAISLIGAATGWELLVIGVIFAIRGHVPQISTFRWDAVVIMLVVSVLIAEAMAVLYTLSWLPKAACDPAAASLEQSINPLCSLRLMGSAIGLAVTPLYVANVWAPISILNPFHGWVIAIAARNWGAVEWWTLWAPAVLCWAFAGMWLCHDWLARKAEAMQASQKAAPEVRVTRRQMKNTSAAIPVAGEITWLLRPLEWLQQTRDNPFINLEWARMRRHPGGSTGVVGWVIIINMIAGVFILGMDVLYNLPNATGETINVWHILLRPSSASGFSLPFITWLISGMALVNLLIGTMGMLLIASGALEMERKALTVNGCLPFLLTTPLSEREILGGLIQGKLFATLLPAMALTGTGFALLIADICVGAPGLFLLWGLAAVVVGLGAGLFFVTLTGATFGPERWRPWAVGAIALAWILGALVGIIAACAARESSWPLSVFWLAIGVASILGLFLCNGLFRLGQSGIRRYRRADLGVRAM